MSKYQLFDALTPEEYNSLRESIIAVGVRVPIVLCGDTGDVIDGHHRLKICEDLKITNYPIEKVYGLSEIEKRQMARSLNMARRHLTQEQRRKQIQDQLRDTPELSDRAIAASIGVTNKTVGVQRREMVRREEIPHIEKTIDTLGREQPRRPVSVINPTDRQERLLKDPAVIERMAADGLTSPVYSGRVLRKESKAARKDISGLDLDDSFCQLIQRDIRDGLPEIPDSSISLVLCDPPYAREYLYCYEQLAILSNRVLTDGGSLLCMTGQSHLVEVMTALSKHLKYHWVLSYLTPAGGCPSLPWRGVSPGWKPILWFTKGNYKYDLQYDVLKAPVEKDGQEYHEWGQSLDVFERLIERFTDPGQTVLDPMVGGGTCAVSAVKLRRKFIGADISDACLQTTRERVAELLNGENPPNGEPPAIMPEAQI